jgi:hypothetical protein
MLSPRFSTSLALAALASAGAVAHAAPLTLAELAPEFGLDAAAIAQVRQGKMVPLVGREAGECDLAVGFVFLVKAPPREVAAAFRAGNDLGSDPSVVASHQLAAAGTAADFDQLRLEPHGADEAKRYGRARPGDTLNLSTEELAAFDKLGGGAAQADVERLLRRTLLARYQAYRSSGLDGIAPYARGGGQLRQPGAELRLVDALAGPMLQKYVPAFKAVVEGYPQARPAGLEETFHWIVYNQDDRPTVTLRHRLTLAVAEGLVAADRTFYVSQGYNSVQALAGILAVEGGTIVFYRCHTSTDRVGGFAASSKHSIGRRVMAKQLEKIFERSRERVSK